MKKHNLFVFLMLLIAFACDDSEDSLPNEKSIKVSSFSEVQIGSNTVIRFDPTVDSQTIIIRGKPEQVAGLKAEVSNNTLTIGLSQDHDLQDSLTIIANPTVLASITLEADQKAVVYWDGDHETLLNLLKIKTEANSMLGVFNVRANFIDIQQEAQSKVELESWHSENLDSLTVLKSDVLHVDEIGYVVDDDNVFSFEPSLEIEHEGKTYYVIRDQQIRKFFLIPNVTARLQATSELQAKNLPIRTLNIKLEGESTASVWVLDSLSGKGEGKSSLQYIGSPLIDYITQGEASIEKY